MHSYVSHTFSESTHITSSTPSSYTSFFKVFFFFVITVIYNFPLFTGIDRFPEIFQNVDIYAIDLHDIVSHNTLFDVMVTVEL